MRDGHTLQDFNFGTATGVTNAEQSVTHGIKNAAGVATAPTVILCALDNLGINETPQASSVTSTKFTISTSGTRGRTVWWLALLA